jgi:AcrR family transcriptional regulator
MRKRLTRELVVSAALRIVDRDGLDAFTMRALGRELGVDPMAAYHHLPNKAAVLDAIAEAVVSEVPDPSPELPCHERLAELARGYRAALRRHPNALPAVATRPDTSRAALHLIDTALGILLAAGRDEAAALTTVHAVSCFVVGHALDESGAEDAAEAAVTQAALLESYPSLARAAAASATLTPDDTFEAGLAALIGR